MKFKSSGPPVKNGGPGVLGPVAREPFPPVGGNVWSTTRRRAVAEEPELPPVKRFVARPDGRFQYWEQ